MNEHAKYMIHAHKNAMLTGLRQLKEHGVLYRFGPITQSVNQLFWEVIKTDVEFSTYSPRHAIVPQLTHKVIPRILPECPNLTPLERLHIEYIYEAFNLILDNPKKPNFWHSLSESAVGKASMILEWDVDVPSVEAGILMLQVWGIDADTANFEVPPPSDANDLTISIPPHGIEVTVSLKGKARVVVMDVSKDFVGAFYLYLKQQYGDYEINPITMAQKSKTLEN